MACSCPKNCMNRCQGSVILPCGREKRLYRAWITGRDKTIRITIQTPVELDSTDRNCCSVCLLDVELYPSKRLESPSLRSAIAGADFPVYLCPFCRNSRREAMHPSSPADSEMQPGIISIRLPAMNRIPCFEIGLIQRTGDICQREFDTSGISAQESCCF